MTAILGNDHLNTLDQHLHRWVQENHCTGFVAFDEIDYGLGLVCFSSKYGNLVGHDGSDQGYQSWMLFMPSSKTSIILLANNNPPHLSLEAFLEAVF